MILSGRFIEYLLDRPDVYNAWQAHTEHKFVAGLADGTLPVVVFKNYLIQDYLFLVRGGPSVIPRTTILTSVPQIQFARANALSAYKAKTIENIAAVRWSYRRE